MKNNDWIKCTLRDDSRNVLARIPDNSIDFILTDPPYNIGKHSTGNIPLPVRSPMNNDVAPWDQIDFNPEEWADEFIRILKPEGNLFIFTSYNQIGRWYDCLDHRFDTTNFMIWHKTNPAPKIFKAGFLNSCEMIFTCWNRRHTWNFLSQAEMHNFFESPICMRPERLSNPKHPAQKPLALLRKIIRIASNPGDIIFDPFMGVGSTGVAALELGRKFIGVEINEEYFTAAKRRIEQQMETMRMAHSASPCPSGTMSAAEEPVTPYVSRQPEPDSLPYLESALPEVDGCEPAQGIAPAAAGGREDLPVLLLDEEEEAPSEDKVLKPLLKWAGGKEKELKYILPALPEFENYYEPFVGGGAVYMAVKAGRSLINDLSSELTAFYEYIRKNDKEFFRLVSEIDGVWQRAFDFFSREKALTDIYLRYRLQEIDDAELKAAINAFCKERKDAILALLPRDFSFHHEVLLKEMNKNLLRKMKRMRELEMTKHLLPEDDLADNIETAVKGAVYMYFRHLYNDKELCRSHAHLACALFYFIRNYCYSGMFRYNDKGDFNVPYGGIAYNSKTMAKKLAYFRSRGVRSRFENTAVFNMDFEEFLRRNVPGERDFVFLDPPYDSEFSTYARNEFTRDDQRRLAAYLINECKAKWMLVIKNTEFIYSLYDVPGVRITAFDKEYLVSFMNRNDKKVTHLMITNY